MLRIVRRGDRHDPRDLTVSFRFEGEFSAAFLEGNAAGILPGETIKNLVHAAAREHGAKEIETLGIALCARAFERQPRITRVRRRDGRTRWQRLEAGGKAQPQTFIGGSDERRTAIVTSNGKQVSVVAGIEDLTLMRSAGFAPGERTVQDDGRSDGLQPLLVGDLSARWTYTSGDVTFGPYRQGVRSGDPRDLRLASEPVGPARAVRGRRRDPHDLRRDRGRDARVSRTSVPAGRPVRVRGSHESGRTVCRDRRTGWRRRSDGRPVVTV